MDKREAEKLFVCSEEAANLLNCVTQKEYNELKCVPLIKKLRSCVKREVRQQSGLN